MAGLLSEIFNSDLTPEQKAVRDRGLTMGLLNAGTALSAASAPGGNHNPAALFSQAARGFMGGNMAGREQMQQQQGLDGMLRGISDPALRAAATANPEAYTKHMIEAKMRAQKPEDRFVTVQNPLGRGGVGQMNQATGKLVNYQAPKSGSDVPTIKSFYDKDGAEYKAQWNPKTREWDRIGGTKSGKNTMALDANQLLGAEQKLFGQFEKSIATEAEQVGAYRRIEAIYQDPQQAQLDGVEQVKMGDGSVFKVRADGAGDLALIFNYMKMLDPRSVVREGEFAMVGKTGGIPSFLKTSLNKVLTGEQLDEDVRRRIVRQSRNQFDSAQKRIQNKLAAAKKRAKLYSGMGVDPERALTYESYNPILEPSVFAEKPSTVFPVNSPAGAANMSNEQLLRELQLGGQ